MHTLVLPIVIVWLLYLFNLTFINLTDASIIALGLLSQVAGMFLENVVVKITLQCHVCCKMCLTRGQTNFGDPHSVDFSTNSSVTWVGYIYMWE